MSSPVKRCVERLAELIGYRTVNPGGDEPALARRLAELLAERGADDVSVTEVPRHRDGRDETGAYVYARWGTPRWILNAHLDTVPANTGWSSDPFDAIATDEHVVGLGACDTKGAIAAALVALEEAPPRDVGMLFSGDEERGSTCIRHFLDSGAGQGVQRAIVCEPTARRAGIAHRGIEAWRAEIKGKGGHSSAADHMPKPVVTMARLAVALDELAGQYLDQGPDDMKGLCMNVARLDGGVAMNVVPDDASLMFSLRPYPGLDADRVAAEIGRCARESGEGIRLTKLLTHLPFAARDPDALRRLLGDRVREVGSLQFWTEAAVFVRAGIDAVVVGPGDIAQAHAADEFVTHDDLAWSVELFSALLSDATS